MNFSSGLMHQLNTYIPGFISTDDFILYLCIRHVQLSISGWGADAGWENRNVCIETPHPHQPSHTHCCRASVSCCCRVSVVVSQKESRVTNSLYGSRFWSFYSLSHMTCYHGQCWYTFFSQQKAQHPHRSTNPFKWIPSHCTLFLLTWQRQRKRDGGDILLQEGGPCSDCHALYGTSSYRGMHVVTYHFIWNMLDLFFLLMIAYITSSMTSVSMVL